MLFVASVGPVLGILMTLAIGIGAGVGVVRAILPLFDKAEKRGE